MLVMGRYKVIIWRFFTLIIAWSVLQNSGGTLVYRYNEGPVDWQSAQTECQNSGGNLVNGSTEYQLMNCTSFPKNKNFWIGMYSMFSSWIQITGCFQLNTSFITGQFYTEDALECSENCGTYFGLMNESCFCLSDDWSNDDNILVPDSLCPNKCKGNGQDSCGGNNYTTVYNKVQDQNITDRGYGTAKDNIMCGLVECTDTGWQYYGYACNQSLQAYCNDMNKTTEYTNWEAGQKGCWDTYNSFLMGATIQNVKCWTNGTNGTNETSAPSWIGLYRRKITKTVHGNSPITTSSCFNGALVDDVLQKDNNISCQSNLPFVCQLETDDVLDNDCVVFPSKETPWTTTELPELSSSDIQTTTSVELSSSDIQTTSSVELSSSDIQTTTSVELSSSDIQTTTSVELSSSDIQTTTSVELSSSDIQTTTSVETTDKASITTKKSTVISKEPDIGLRVGVLVLLGMVLIVIVGTVACHCLYGQRPLGQKVVGDINDDTVNARYTDFYIRPNSDDMSEISPRYSLFEEDTDDVTGEADEPIVSYGRVSTFLHIPGRTGEHNMQYINENDNITTL